jgi:ABC-type sugar transport system ATPase subunit/ribose/xylose/arabinose/galactoside ABC-type transport system permease subunit
VRFRDSNEAEAVGIVLIHQELNLVPDLTVEENVFLGREPHRFGFVDAQAARRTTRELLATLRTAVPVTRRVRELSVSQAQMVEIAKAVSRKVRVLCMDEPTDVLTGRETEVLFELVRRLVADGVAILYVSHKLDEIKAIADRVTILRDGDKIGTFAAADLTPAEMARRMVGRDLADMYPPRRRCPTTRRWPSRWSASWCPASSRGDAGACGAARCWASRAWSAPAAPSCSRACWACARHGGVRKDGRGVRWRHAEDAKHDRVAYLTEDRKGKGLLLAKSLRENVTLQSLERFARPFVNGRAEQRALERPPASSTCASRGSTWRPAALSGGNQQKVVLAKLMLTDPDVVILDEPTRGIDVGTKRQIYFYVGELLAKGVAVVLISSELPEILGLAHRVVVMHDGVVTGTLPAAGLDEETVMAYATGLRRDPIPPPQEAPVSTPETAVAPTWRARLRQGAVAAAHAAGRPGAAARHRLADPPGVPHPTNLFNVLTRSAFIGIIAVGGTFVIIGGGIDLSVGSMAAFLSGAMILLMNALHGGTISPVGVVLIGVGLVLASGLLAGAANGLAITRGRIEPFIVTLGTLGIFRSLVTYLADGGTISLNFALRGVYRPVFYGSFLGIPIPVWAFAVVAVLGAILLHRTRFGRYVRAIGSNQEVARYAAIRVARIRTLTYVIQGLCVAIAVVLYVPRLGSASASTGILWELEAIAAVIIGGTALKGGSGHVWGTVVGAIMLSLIGNVLNLTSAISEYLNGAVQGLIIIGAVFLQRGRQGR